MRTYQAWIKNAKDGMSYLSETIANSREETFIQFKKSDSSISIDNVMWVDFMPGYREKMIELKKEYKQSESKRTFSEWVEVKICGNPGFVKRVLDLNKETQYTKLTKEQKEIIAEFIERSEGYDD